MRRFSLCGLRGHRGFRQSVLPEINKRYNHGPRDDYGRALTWPECRRCGFRAVTTEVVGEPAPDTEVRK